MKDITSHIKKAAGDVSLSEKERAYMSRVVHEYVAMKPLTATMYTSASIEWFAFSWIRQPIAAALALVFIFTSGVSYAAESAVPGDALYSVKKNVNESLKVALATSAEAKANVQIELAERRIEEAAVLASEDRLDVETQGELASAFQAHADEATAEVAAIEEEDSSLAAEITSRFETRLVAHEAVLALVSEDVHATNTLSFAIGAKARAVADIRARAEERSSVSAPVAVSMMAMAMDAAPQAESMSLKVAATEPAADVATTVTSELSIDVRAAERMRLSAEAQVKAATKQLKSTKLKGQEKADAEASIDAAQDRITAGRTLLDEKAIAHAYHAFQESLVISEKLSVMLNATASIKKASSRATTANDNKRKKDSVDTRARVRAKISEKTDTRIETALDANISSTSNAATPEAATSAELTPVIPPLFQIFNPEKEESESESATGTGDIEVEIGL